MSRFDHNKYQAFKPVGLKDRTWPDSVLNEAPTWCSVDLRDGNQALVHPMSVEQKLELFQLLVDIGFKQIEIGFPAASQPDYDFARLLIERDLIPDDVTVQVLTQARQHLITRTYQALKGVKRAIMHVYNSTSTVQREQVFGMSRDEIRQIAVNGAKMIEEGALANPDTEWVFQYSPESFTGTEMDFAVEVCNAVLEVWHPQLKREVILNIPATVEVSSPNIHADQIEYFCRHIHHRDSVSVSLHTHNDRGCAVAATELGLMAGADRVEGTLFGNGERTGNVDITTLAMNLYSQGVDPELNFENSHALVEVYRRTTGMDIHARHPWFGELVYTAFSGSHQDAIRKSMAYHKEHHLDKWGVAYLPIDPEDLGRKYEEVVRINSQSGKGGVAFVLERDFGIYLPKWLHAPLSAFVQRESERTGKEVLSDEVYRIFELHLLEIPQGWQALGYKSRNQDGVVSASIEFGHGNDIVSLSGEGKGLVEALVDALERFTDTTIEVVEWQDRALEHSTESRALGSIGVNVNGNLIYACAIHEDTQTATVQSLLNAVGRGVIQLKSAA